MSHAHIVIIPPMTTAITAAALLAVGLTGGAPPRRPDIWVIDPDDLPNQLRAVRGMRSTQAWLIGLTAPDHAQGLRDGGQLREINGDDLITTVAERLAELDRHTEEVTALLAQRSRLERKADVILNESAAAEDRLYAIQERLPVLLLPQELRGGRWTATDGHATIDRDLLDAFGVADPEDPLLHAETTQLLLLHSLAGRSNAVIKAREGIADLLHERRRSGLILGASHTGKSHILRLLSERLGLRRRLTPLWIDGHGCAPGQIPQRPPPGERMLIAIDNVDLLSDAAWMRLQALLDNDQAFVVMTAHIDAQHRLESRHRVLARLHPVVLPALADRAQDVPIIAAAMTAVMAQNLDRPGPPPDLDAIDGALSRLTRAQWPHNLSSLAEALERAFRLDDWSFTWLEAQAYGGAAIPLPASSEDVQPINTVIERYIKATYAITQNKADAARLLGWKGPGGRNAIARWIDGRGRLAE